MSLGVKVLDLHTKSRTARLTGLSWQEPRQKCADSC